MMVTNHLLSDDHPAVTMTITSHWAGSPRPRSSATLAVTTSTVRGPAPVQGHRAAWAGRDDAPMAMASLRALGSAWQPWVSAWWVEVGSEHWGCSWQWLRTQALPREQMSRMPRGASLNTYHHLLIIDSSAHRASAYKCPFHGWPFEPNMIGAGFCGAFLGVNATIINQQLDQQ